MPKFAYTARDGSGTASSGILTAESVVEVSQFLRKEGKYPLSVRAADSADPQVAQAGSGVKISRADLILLSTQLAIMIETGVTLSEALDCIAAQTQKPNVARLVEDLGSQVQSGSDFSSALLRHPRSFPQLFIALIKASEKSGMMPKLMRRATDYLREEQETVRRVRGALTYPGIMFGFAITTTIFLLAFVLPRFTAIYASKAAALPTPTKILMMMSEFIVGHWMGLITGTITAVIVGMFYFRTEAGRRTWDFIQLRIPLLGAIFSKLHLSRGLRMVGTMAGAGVNLMDCVKIAQDLCTNSYFRDLWTQASLQIQNGRQLSEPLFQNALVPRSISQMIHSGEKSGKLAHVMEQVAGFSEQELKERIAELTRYIEPAMILVMGFIIGGVALAMLLPIFTISRVMSQ